MRCYICDAHLKQDEIKFHPELKTLEPCKHCLEIIAEVFEDGPDEEEIDRLLGEEWELDYRDPQTPEEEDDTS